MIEYISNIGKMCIEYAGMAELADALDSGSNGRKAVQVQVLLPAPNSRNSNPKPAGEGFEFFLCTVICDVNLLLLASRPSPPK